VDVGRIGRSRRPHPFGGGRRKPSAAFVRCFGRAAFGAAPTSRCPPLPPLAVAWPEFRVIVSPGGTEDARWSAKRAAMDALVGVEPAEEGVVIGRPRNKRVSGGRPRHRGWSRVCFSMGGRLMLPGGGVWEFETNNRRRMVWWSVFAVGNCVAGRPRGGPVRRRPAVNKSCERRWAPSKRGRDLPLGGATQSWGHVGMFGGVRLSRPPTRLP